MRTFEWHSKTLEFTARIKATCNPGEMIRWDHQFTPTINSNNAVWQSGNWNGTDQENVEGELTLDSGEWRIFPYSGEFSASNTVACYIDGALIYIFQDPGRNEEFNVSVPYGSGTKRLQMLQTLGRFQCEVSVHKELGYSTDSYNRPVITGSGEQLNVTLQGDRTPSAGVLVATPKILNAAGEELISGEALTLTINVSSGGC